MKADGLARQLLILVVGAALGLAGTLVAQHLQRRDRQELVEIENRQKQIEAKRRRMLDAMEKYADGCDAFDAAYLKASGSGWRWMQAKKAQTEGDYSPDDPDELFGRYSDDVHSAAQAKLALEGREHLVRAVFRELPSFSIGAQILQPGATPELQYTVYMSNMKAYSERCNKLRAEMAAQTRE
jgi:hypothetical protein